MKMKKNGFTLIELLVVISIIIILVSMLLPALNSARDRAKAAKCLSNIKQTGMTFSLYANDWRGWMPAIYIDASGMYWGQTLVSLRYVTGSYNCLLCPTRSPYTFLDYAHTYGVWGWQYNSQLSMWSTQATSGIPYTGQGPSSQIVLADSLASAAVTAGQMYHIYGRYNSQRFLDLRHNQKGNAFFADGHGAGVGMKETNPLGMEYYALNNVVLQNW